MKVYVLLHKYNTHEGEIFGIYSTTTAANAAKDKQRKEGTKQDDLARFELSYPIEEWEVEL